MPTPPRKPFGRSLNDFGELLPAESQLRDAARLGETAIIGSERPTKRSPENEIRAAFLRFLALGGDENAPVHEQGVRGLGAWISGVFDVTACDIPGNFVVGNSHFAETPVLRDAHFHGSLNLIGSQLPGLSADRLITDGSIFFRNGFSSSGEVRLLGAHIAGNVTCNKGNFNNPNGYALNADGANIQGDVFLNERFQAQGEVRLLGAFIGGDLECSKGSFTNPDGDALSADRATIEGNINFDENFQAQGEVRLLGAHIGGDLACRKGSFTNPDGDALSADRATIEGNIYFDEGFQAQGAVRLIGAQIAGNLNCNGGSFSHAKGAAFVAERISVTGNFVFRSLRKPVTGINLNGAEVGTLVDDEPSWGSGLALDGFVYHRLGGNAPCDAATRIAWLNKQRDDHCSTPNSFKPQPWKQLIRTLRKTGHEEAARQVAIAYETHRREIGLVKGWGKQKLHQAFGWLADYGYRPLKLLKQMLQVWLACAVLYWIAAMYGVFAPSNPLIFNHPDYQHCSPGYTPENSKRDNLAKVLYCTEKQANSQENSLNSKACSCETSLSCQAENPAPKEKFGNWYLCPDLAGEYTGFSPLAYSLDLILPLVDLQQEHDWAPYVPTPDKLWFQELISLSRYHLTRLLVWFEILFGWVASLLLVAVVSGLTNRDKDD